MFLIALILSWVGCRPTWFILWPRHSTSGAMKVHLDFFSLGQLSPTSPALFPGSASVAVPLYL